MKRKRILSAVLMCAVGVGICGLYCGLMPRRYTVSTPKLNAEERLRIVMLSDLHSYVYGNDQTPLLRRVKELQPDIIALCGDIVDDGNKTQHQTQRAKHHGRDAADGGMQMLRLRRLRLRLLWLVLLWG